MKPVRLPTRGIAPLIVAVVSVGLLGEHLSHASQIAVLLIALGITSLALTRGAATLRHPRPVRQVSPDIPVPARE